MKKLTSKMNGLHKARPSKMRGFSLVEVLVAVLIMGVGVLGVTGLQMVSLQNNRDALLRGDGLQMAYDIMDRMRMNPTGNYGNVAFDDDPAAPTDCVANVCTADQMAVYDIAVWKCSLGDHSGLDVCDDLRSANAIAGLDDQPGLPEGQGQISIVGQVVEVTVRWTAFNGQQEDLVIESQR